MPIKRVLTTIMMYSKTVLSFNAMRSFVVGNEAFFNIISVTYPPVRAIVEEKSLNLFFVFIIKYHFY